MTLRNMDVAGCKKACEEAVGFECLSFDIYSTTCYLSYMDRRGASLSTHASYTYYERDCSGTVIYVQQPNTNLFFYLFNSDN